MFQLAVRGEYLIKSRCSRHPAYNPVKDEQGGIKGECTECYEFLNAYRAYITLREAIEAFERKIQPFITIKQARGMSVHGSHPSAPELSLPVARRRIPANSVLIAPEALSETASEKEEQFNGRMPGRGIATAFLLSLAFWTCLGAVLWRCGVVRW